METLTKVKPAPEKENNVQHDSVLAKAQQAKPSTLGFSSNGANSRHISMNGSHSDDHWQTIPSVAQLATEEEHESYHTWRYELVTLPDGTTKLKQIPLPRERFLNPQEGDHFMQSNTHHTLAGSVHNRYENRYGNDDSIGVFSDLKMQWGIEGLDEPAPDVAVVPNLNNPEKHRGTFKVTEEGTKPMFIVEVTSPTYPFDKKKVPLYEQVGIQEYIIVDPHWGSDKELEFFGYELVDGSYQPMQTDSQGRLYSATTDTYLFFEQGKGDEIIAQITDGTTGEQILDNKGSHQARLEAEERADSEKERADSESQRADEETVKRQAAEARAKEAEERIAAALAEIERLRADNAQGDESHSDK